MENLLSKNKNHSDFFFYIIETFEYYCLKMCPGPLEFKILLIVTYIFSCLKGKMVLK